MVSSAWVGLQLIDLANNIPKGNSTLPQLLACTWLSSQQRYMAIFGKHIEWDLKGWWCILKSMWLQLPVGMEHSLVPAVLGEWRGRGGMRHLSLTCNGRQESFLCLKDSEMVLGHFLPLGRHSSGNQLKCFAFIYNRTFVNCQCPHSWVVLGAKAAMTESYKTIYVQILIWCISVSIYFMVLLQLSYNIKGPDPQDLVRWLWSVLFGPFLTTWKIPVWATGAQWLSVNQLTLAVQYRFPKYIFCSFNWYSRQQY